jgi:hypothetical protein
MIHPHKEIHVVLLSDLLSRNTTPPAFQQLSLALISFLSNSAYLSPRTTMEKSREDSAIGIPAEEGGASRDQTKKSSLNEASNMLFFLQFFSAYILCANQPASWPLRLVEMAMAASSNKLKPERVKPASQGNRDWVFEFTVAVGKYWKSQRCGTLLLSPPSPVHRVRGLHILSRVSLEKRSEDSFREGRLFPYSSFRTSQQSPQSQPRSVQSWHFSAG